MNSNAHTNSGIRLIRNTLQNIKNAVNGRIEIIDNSKAISDATQASIIPIIINIHLKPGLNEIIIGWFIAGCCGASQPEGWS